jgi:hypothetical protein
VQDDSRGTEAAAALFAAWCELSMLPRGVWPLVLDAIELELTREPVLLALAPAARAHVELHCGIRRCGCGERAVFGGACGGCVDRCAGCEAPVGPGLAWCASCAVLGAGWCRRCKTELVTQGERASGLCVDCACEFRMDAEGEVDDD